MVQLNEEQIYAVNRMSQFIHSREGEGGLLLLRGAAGTGKTTAVKEIPNCTEGRLIFTAPTNKATKVLRDTLTSEDYKPECRTIYSLLGLSLSPSGEVKVLQSPEDPVDLSRYSAVFVDEGSMINRTLWKHIQETSHVQGVKFIFLADAAQLPPVGESHSEIFSIPDQIELTKVVRHDNAILSLATAVREQVDAFCPQISFRSDHVGLSDGTSEGVWETGSGFDRFVIEAAGRGDFSDGKRAKVIAWRNTTVYRYNAMIRRCLFPSTWEMPWLAEDRIVVAAPVRDLTIPKDKTIATTDDEGVIQRVDIVPHPLHPAIKCWRLYTLLDTNEAVPIYVCHEDSTLTLQAKLNQLSAAAKRDSKRWKEFWAYKESFHAVRHAYAITAHRSQGSTYQEVYVKWRDILVNPHRNEAFRCLYVACSRARKKVFLG